MKLTRILRASAATLAIASASAIATAPVAYAQTTVSSIRGVITSEDGAPLSGATVTVTDTRTGASQTLTTGDSGQYSARNLSVGGPYNVSVSREGFASERLEGVFVNLSGPTTANIDLAASAQGGGDEIVVVATRSNTQQLAIGPSSTFSLETIEALPSISRDIRDIIRVDPRLTVSGGDDQVSCLGGNSRATSFTIDGVQTNDAFGLNASGTPSRANFPLPFDAIQETAVEFAPYDVEYGQFTTCNINIVTKSGSNEFHGSAFAVFNNRSLTGSQAGDFTVLGDAPFRDFNWGAEVRGPIIKDTLFLAVAYEEIRDGGTIVGFGPEDGTFANPVENFTFADLDEITAIANSLGFETGGLASVVPETSRRLSTRVDWYLSDQHRLEANYVRERELETETDLQGVDFQPLNSFENSGSSNERYSFRLFSEWTPEITTEIRVSRTDNQDIQSPVGGGEAQSDNPIPRFLIQGGDNGPFGGGDDGIQITGPGIFRSANELITQLDQVKFKLDYQRGNHLLTGGYELNSLEVFNLFIIDATGSIRFDDADAFAAGTANEITINATASGDPNDAAAEFTRNIHSLYFQDTWTPTDALKLSLGLRYDFYQSQDVPTASPLFEQRYGFSNATGFNDFSILLPRFGLNYDAGSTFFGETSFRAGAGVFSGGDPTVFYSNAFTNNGFGTAFAASFFGLCTDDELDVIDDAGNFTGVPSCITDAAAAGASSGNGRTDAIDPNLNVPSVVRGSLGFTHFTDFGGAAGGLFDDWTVNVDLIYTANRNSFDFIDLTLSPVGTAPDGRALLEAIDPLRDDCNATFIGPRAGFANVTDDCFTSRDQDILLTNVDGDNGRSISFSTQFAKTFEYDLFNRPASWSVNLGYAYTDATQVVGSLSSTATSNFEEVATVVPNQNFAAPSQFLNRHVVSLASTFRQEFVADLPTSFSFFVSAREGNPFSYVFEDDTGERVFGDSDDENRILLTVPTGPNDPLFDFSNVPADNLAELFAFLDSSGLSEFAGGFAPRNQFRDPWFVDVDFRFQQELPTLVDGLRSIFYVDIENFLNLIDSDRNVLRTFDRGNSREGVPVFEIDEINDQGQFVVNARGLESQITGGSTGDIFDRNAAQSLWAVQFGLRFEF
ncbi:MAG: TonB-dependent receptor [Pseudomonadota bacterium]